jgi:hypothetical protein
MRYGAPCPVVGAEADMRLLLMQPPWGRILPLKLPPPEQLLADAGDDRVQAEGRRARLEGVPEHPLRLPDPPVACHHAANARARSVFPVPPGPCITTTRCSRAAVSSS